MSQCCPECSRYGDHFGWCSQARCIEDLFAEVVAELVSVPFAHEDFWLAAGGAR